MRARRTSIIATSIVALVVALLTVAGAASAGPAAKGEKGDPQPELGRFTIGAQNLGATDAILPDGDIVTVYGIKKGTSGAIGVCRLARGGHTCASKTELTVPSKTDSVGGLPEVLALGGNRVGVLMDDCCDKKDDSREGDDVLFLSKDGGRTFDSGTRVGTLGITSAALVGGQIVFTAGDNIDGTVVESVSDTSPTAPAEPYAKPMSHYTELDAVTSYHSGALVASDNGSTTYVAYASSGKDFNKTSSYTTIVKFHHQSLIALSGSALLTQRTTGKEPLVLQLFNGKTFGPPHTVPGTSGGGPQWFALDQDASGETHVFSERGYNTPTYSLQETSTRTGASWTKDVDLGDASPSDGLQVALDRNGSGLVVGSGEDKTQGYPVLEAQRVSLTAHPASIRKGRKATLSGSAAPKAHGLAIELQVERKGRWYDVAKTHESAAGKFAFTVKGSTPGTYTYRAVAADRAGYVMYGYSPSRRLDVES